MAMDKMKTKIIACTTDGKPLTKEDEEAIEAFLIERKLRGMKTLTQVEQLTGIKASTLRQRINRGTLKATKIGKTWVLSTREIKKLLEKYLKEKK